MEMKNAEQLNLMHLVLDMEVGGLERVVVDSVLATNRELFNVQVCCYNDYGSLAECLQREGIKVSLLNQGERKRSAYFCIPDLSRILSKSDIHILHMHSGTFFAGTMAGILAGTPVKVYTDHGRHLVDPLKLLLMDRISGLFVDRIVAVSKDLEKYLLEIVKLPRSKTTTIINGIDTDKFAPRRKPDDLLAQFDLRPDDKIIGSVGRLVEVKDYASLVKSFKIVREQIPNSVLVLVGDGPTQDDLSELASQLGVLESVRFLGNRADVHRILNLFDVFALTSLSEGTSVSLLEAMASGIAPLATDVGGNAALIESGINGVLVRPKDIDGIARELVKMLHDDDGRAFFATNAVTRVKKDFSLRAMVDSYASLYTDAYNSKTGRGNVQQSH